MEQFLKLSFKPYFYDQMMYENLNIKLSEKTAKNATKVRALIIKEFPGKANPYEDLTNFTYKDFSKFTFPVLLIHGRNDPMPVHCTEEMHQFLPNSKLHILENCGHFPYIEEKETTFELISEFIKNLS
jgi:pimeloyl-ACP methyl ester carboxylesterase